MVAKGKMCWALHWELEGGNSRDLGRGNARRLKAREREAGEALKGTLEQELHYKLVKKQGKVKEEAASWWEKRRYGQEVLNPSSGDQGRGPCMDPRLWLHWKATGAFCSMLLSIAFACLCAPGGKA